jgi:protocatechuate 3,4-dioxygenase beta subunit
MHDDAGAGRLLSRREALTLLATGGALSVTRSLAADAPRCVVLPQQTEGPFFVDEQLERSDIRTDPTSRIARPGTPLAVTFVVSQLAGGRCAPLAGAQVDVWHCDAAGAYSDVGDTRGQAFLRGYQRTDESGAARFTTIYPGWYYGRTVHIHFKVRTTGGRFGDREFTSQLYFDDALTDRVHAATPYGVRGQRPSRNREDGLFRRGGEQLMPALRPTGAGYATTLAIALAA